MRIFFVSRADGGTEAATGSARTLMRVWRRRDVASVLLAGGQSSVEDGARTTEDSALRWLAAGPAGAVRGRMRLDAALADRLKSHVPPDRAVSGNRGPHAAFCWPFPCKPSLTTDREFSRFARGAHPGRLNTTKTSTDRRKPTRDGGRGESQDRGFIRTMNPGTWW